MGNGKKLFLTPLLGKIERNPRNVALSPLASVKRYAFCPGTLISAISMLVLCDWTSIRHKKWFEYKTKQGYHNKYIKYLQLYKDDVTKGQKHKGDRYIVINNYLYPKYIYNRAT